MSRLQAGGLPAGVVAAALLAGGAVLVVFGFNAMESPSSDISRFFTGAPTDRSLWLLGGGSAMMMVGLVLALGALRK